MAFSTSLGMNPASGFKSVKSSKHFLVCLDIITNNFLIDNITINHHAKHWKAKQRGKYRSQNHTATKCCRLGNAF